MQETESLWASVKASVKVTSPLLLHTLFTAATVYDCTLSHMCEEDLSTLLIDLKKAINRRVCNADFITG